MSKKLSLMMAATLAAALVLGACMPTPVSQDVSMTRIAESAHGTMTAVAQGTAIPANPAPESTPEPSPTAEVPVVQVTQMVYVTATPGAGTSQVTSQGIRLSMALGGTDVSASGKVAAGKTVRYVFGALKGQLINLTLSTGSNAVLGVRNAAGTVLLDPAKAWTNFRVYLPAGGDWFIDVYGGNTDADYSLYLSIPARLSFASGSSSMSGKGSIGNGNGMQFIVYARAGQNLKASVDAAGLGLSIYAVEGTVLKSPMGEGASFDGKLPVTGDYIFNVFSVPGSAPTNFSLAIEIR